MAVTLYLTSMLVLAALVNVNALQEQEIDSGPSSLSLEVKSLQKNITDLWNYIYDLRNAMSAHLVHLRKHQMEVEATLHHMTHHSGGEDHHHYHETGPNQEESHSHMDSHDHGHGSSHEHSDDHGHGHGSSHEHSDDHGHSHDHGDDHGHGQDYGDDHGHSHDHHDDHQESHSHHHEVSTDSHSHDGHDQNQGEDHHHHHSKENHSDEKQQENKEQQKEEVVEKVVAATNVVRHDHHHHHNHGKDPLNLFNHRHSHGRSRNFTAIPRISESDSFNFAICDVKPNTAISAELQQDVRGQISLWQNKQGGPLGIHVRLSGFSMGGHGQHHQQQQNHHGHEVGHEEQDTDVTASLGHKHGFHIHEHGDLSNSCQSLGGHYNPKGVDHKGPTAAERHVGDLGNIECDEHGYTNIIFSDDEASLSGPYSIIGRSMVVHANPDDYGTNPENPESLLSGNAGTRIACCVIQRVDRLPIRAHKSMKIAKQYKN